MSKAKHCIKIACTAFSDTLEATKQDMSKVRAGVDYAGRDVETEVAICTTC